MAQLSICRAGPPSGAEGTQQNFSADSIELGMDISLTGPHNLTISRFDDGCDFCHGIIGRVRSFEELPLQVGGTQMRGTEGE